MPDDARDPVNGPPPELAQMQQSLGAAQAIYRHSPFWDELAEQHSMQLAGNGFANFKRTINLKYFNWGTLGILAHQMGPLVWWWLRHGSGHPFAAQILDKTAADNPYNAVTGKIYAIFVALLYQKVASDCGSAVFEKSPESSVGNPILVDVGNGLHTTQDLCNSVHEFSRVIGLLGPQTPRRVLEIGAGYGRVAAVFLGAVPGVKYWIVDIPPALYVSQRYLSEAFPGKKIFSYRPFENFPEVAAEVEESDICFFMSNQILMLPDKSVDATICISNLHEMTRQQIELYYQQINRLTAGIFYTKQWMRSIASENKFSIARNEYPVPADWITVLDARHPIQSWFFEAGYQIA